MLRGAALGALMLVAGCASQAHGLDPFVGQSIDTAIGKLGYPDLEREVAGHHLLTWGTTTPCQLDMETDAARRVINWQTHGANFACERYAR